MILNTQQKQKQCAIVVGNFKDSALSSLLQRRNARRFQLASGLTTPSALLITQATGLAPLAPKAATVIMR